MIISYESLISCVWDQMASTPHHHCRCLPEQVFSSLDAASWTQEAGPANLHGVYNNNNNNNNNNNKVNLYSTIPIQICSTALLEKSSMLGQSQIIYQVMYNEYNWHLCMRKSLHKQVGFQLSLKWNNWLGFPKRKRKVVPILRCSTRKSTISQCHFCLRSWHFKEPFIIWTTKIM